MSFYVQLDPSGEFVGVWDIGLRRAERVDGVGERPVVPDGADPLEIVRKFRPGHRFHRLRLPPGEYYPRIARPFIHPARSPGTNPANSASLAQLETSRGQLMALRENLDRICRVVQPHRSNFGAFGHDIRNLLILAATEFEAQCKGILKANSAPANNSSDYVRLHVPLRLEDYAIAFPYFPWLDRLRPFAGWDAAAPTQSLDWFDVYSDVKQDRDRNFDHATLGQAINAVAGCFVMFLAQYGTDGYPPRESLDCFFVIADAPHWDPSEIYCPAYQPTFFPIARQYKF
jgi:hypothetical protein